MKSFLESFLDKVPEKYQGLAKQFLKFGITGAVGAVVDFTTYGFLTRVIGWTTFYTVGGFQIIVANNVSVFLAIISNFILNKYWTFRFREGNVATQWVSYLTLNIFTWILNQLLVSYFIFDVPAFEQIFGDNRDYAAKVAAIGLILFINFFGSKFLIFRRKPARSTSSAY